MGVPAPRYAGVATARGLRTCAFALGFWNGFVFATANKGSDQTGAGVQFASKRRRYKLTSLETQKQQRSQIQRWDRRGASLILSAIRNPRIEGAGGVCRYLLRRRLYSYFLTDEAF